MTTRYQMLERGVYDTMAGHAISPTAFGEWTAYIAWLAEGNAPDPYIAPPPPELSADEVAARAEIAATNAIRDQLRGNTLIQQLRTRTPAQVDDWINTNVTDLASAKVVLRILAYVVAWLARERLR